MFWQYQTISQGTNSIIEQLKADPNISDPLDYIVFFSLRAHALMPNNQPTTEMVYIHSKLIIVDDQSVLIGSANINDRSLRGLRDSEIAQISKMIAQDMEKIPAKMNEQPYDAAKFAHTLRKSLFQEHFALTEYEVVDPLSDKLFIVIKERIQVQFSDFCYYNKKNTKLYRDIFHCYPDSEIKTYDDMNQALKMQPSVENYQNLSGQIQGFGVEYPLYFLEKENLRPYFTQKEFYVPICFT